MLRMSASRYAKNAGAVFSLKFHLVWCPKYRRPVLTPPVDGRLKALPAEIADDHGMTLHATEVMPDHSRPPLCRGGPDPLRDGVVNRLKGRTSRLLRQEFPALRSRLPTLWSRSYFAASVGAVSEAMIRRYIEAQKGV